MRTAIVVLFLLASLANNTQADPSTKGDKGATSGPRTPQTTGDRGGTKKDDAPTKGADPDKVSAPKDRR